MAKYVGRRRTVGFALEASRGVAEAEAAYCINDANYNLVERVVKARNNQAFGRIEGNLYAEIVKQMAEGDVQFAIQDKSIGTILKALFGAVNTANHSGETTVKDHTFTVANTNNHASLTAFLDDPAIGKLAYANAMIDSFEFSAEAAQEEYIGATLGLQAKYPVASSFAVARGSQNEFRARDVAVKLATNLAGLGAASAISVRSVNFSINKNVKDLPALGSVDPIDFANQTVEVEGSIKLYLDDDTYRTLMANGTFKALRVQLTRSDVTIGSAANPGLYFDFAKVDFDEWNADRGNDDIVLQTLNFKGSYSLADAEMIKAVLTNTVASY